MILRDPHARAGRVHAAAVLLLVLLPLLGYGVYRLLHTTRLVTREELIGVWHLVAAPDANPHDAQVAWLASLTNQWLALGSKNTCWYHAPSPSMPWRGKANRADILEYGESFTPVAWPGGPPAPGRQAADEPGRRKPREISLSTLSWAFQPISTRGGTLGLAEVVIEREGRREGGITLEALRDRDGEAMLRVMALPAEGPLTMYFRRSAALDIDNPSLPVASPTPDPTS